MGKLVSSQLNCILTHVIAFSDPVELWVIKIKKPDPLRT